MDLEDHNAEKKVEAKLDANFDVPQGAAPLSDAEKDARRGKMFVRLSIICPAVSLAILELFTIVQGHLWIKESFRWLRIFDWFFLINGLMLILGMMLGIAFGIAALRRRRWWGIAGIALALAALPNPLAYCPGPFYSWIYRLYGDVGNRVMMTHTPVQWAMIRSTFRLMPHFYAEAEISDGGKTLRRYNRRVGYLRTSEKYAIPDGVTTIGEGAFRDCNNLKSVTIPSSVTSIGERAFYGCENLRSVTIPASIKTIGEEAFRECNNLESVTIPSSVISIGDRAFAGCPLTSVTIPPSVKTIGDGAFAGCPLTSVTIPEGVTTIGDYAFAGCPLTSVTIPPGVTTIGRGAFEYCRSLTSVTIPASVTSIGNWAFSGCEKLTSVTIPASVTTIGEWAFAGCPLTSVTIPPSVKTIGYGAFAGCPCAKDVMQRFPGSGGEPTRTVPPYWTRKPVEKTVTVPREPEPRMRFRKR